MHESLFSHTDCDYIVKIVRLRCTQWTTWTVHASVGESQKKPAQVDRQASLKPTIHSESNTYPDSRRTCSTVSVGTCLQHPHSYKDNSHFCDSSCFLSFSICSLGYSSNSLTSVTSNSLSLLSVSFARNSAARFLPIVSTRFFFAGCVAMVGHWSDNNKGISSK